MSGGNGGSAYPHQELAGPETFQKNKAWRMPAPGMSMRQAYKIAAMAQLARSEFTLTSDKDIVKSCSRIADAMLVEDAEFEKRSGGGV